MKFIFVCIGMCNEAWQFLSALWSLSLSTCKNLRVISEERCQLLAVLLFTIATACSREYQSLTVTDFLLQIDLTDQVALDVIHRLFESVAPIVFRPVDILLKTLLMKPADIVSVVFVTFTHKTST